MRVLWVWPMVAAGGPELTRAETVTLFDDLCLYAPSALIGPSVTWDPVDNNVAIAHFTLGENTISAELHFGDDGDLVDFVSDDRTAASPAGRDAAGRWSTPIRGYAHFGSVRVPSAVDVRWHPPEGAWTYGEFRLMSLSYNTGPSGPSAEQHPSRHMVLPVTTIPGARRS